MYIGVHIIIPQFMLCCTAQRYAKKNSPIFKSCGYKLTVQSRGGGGGGGLGEICLYIQVSDIHTVGWNRVLGIEGLYSLPTIKGDCPVCAVDVYRGAHNYSSKLRYYMLCCTAQRYAQKNSPIFKSCGYKLTVQSRGGGGGDLLQKVVLGCKKQFVVFYIAH